MDSSLLILLIAVTVVMVLGQYFLINTLASRFFENKRLDIRHTSTSVILPLRLQAGERMCLYLERITPDQLLLRTSGMAYSATEYQALLLQEIREEYNHNIAQQLYLSQESWEAIVHAKNETVVLINQAAAALPEGASAADLAQKILEAVFTIETLPTTTALRAVKRDIQALFA